jgi:hypothetical protein
VQPSADSPRRAEGAPADEELRVSEQAAVALAKSLKRSVIVLTDGVTLAAAERVEGEMRGWRVQPAGALLPIDEPRLVAAQPNGARVYPDGRRVGGPEHTSSADFEGGPVEVGGSAADGRPVVYEAPRPVRRPSWP